MKIFRSTTVCCLSSLNDYWCWSFTSNSVIDMWSEIIGQSSSLAKRKQRYLKALILPLTLILEKKSHYYNIWLQQYARSCWLFSCNDRALLARCPRHMQSVFNLMVDIPMDIHVMVNWQLSKRLSTDQCHPTVSRAQVYKSLRWRVF